MAATLIPDILRALITDIMLILLIITMSTPKYKKRYVYVIVISFITLINLAANLYFYLTQNYSAVVVTDFLMLIFIAVALKPFFCETVMQWCFSFVTLMNIYISIVFLSYILCGIFPNPSYGIIVLRAIFFGIIVFIFRKKVGPLYHKVKTYWNVYFLLTVALLINFLYYFLSGNIEEIMTDYFMSILLLVILTFFLYIGIFLSLKIIIQKYTLREENIKIENEHMLLQKISNEMNQRLSLMDDMVKQMRITQHDRRHFNATLYELIEQGETKQALDLINKQSAAFPQGPHSYCENVEVNAAVSYYATIASGKGIACDIKLNIPQKLSTDGLELAMVISNLMENAVHGASDVTDENKRKIKFNAIYTGQLILEITNHFNGKIMTDENGIPISNKSEHGIGTQSVVAFAKKWNAELDYQVSDDTFKVRMMI